MKRRRPLAGTIAVATLVAAAALFTGGSAAVSNDAPFDDGGVLIDDGHVHGDMAGRLDTASSNVSLVGRGQINNPGENRVSDVGVLGNYAYLGAFNSSPCQGGVYIMDIADVRQPRQVGFIASSQGSFVGEGVHPLHISTPAFDGDLLAYSNELCTGASAPPAVGGATLVDISDPLHPVVLANGFGAVEPGVSTRARTVHSTYMWQTGHGPNRKAYIVLPDSRTPMLPIFDITDPRNPVQVIDINLAERYPQILQPNSGLDTVFFHDVVVRRHGNQQIMLLSFWDAGYVKLDVSDPANPVYLADSDFTFPDPELKQAIGEELQPEGNGHYAEFVHNNQYIITTDEDFAATRVVVKTDDGSEFRGAQGGEGSLPTGGSVNGPTIFVGLGCNTSPPPSAPATGGPWIALVERGGCTFTEKAINIESRGYAGTLVFNRTGAGGCGGITAPGVTASKPYFSINRKSGLSILDADAGYNEAACLASSDTLNLPIGTVGDNVSLKASFDGWGYVHLFRNGNGKLQELDTYAVREGMDPGYENGFGSLTVHEVAVSAKNPHLAYLSYYDAGFRVISVKGGKIEEVGHYLDVNGNDFWGVQVFQRGGKEYVLASDRDFGLYVFEYTGKN
ncbi:PA domain-containing protein [Catelliglobosispora koreensis]|uniref:PA domain-containing protein n=1 Tax=Catelliglobosispora koreensis TaxID=129052 RepID=UPI000377C99B|nr:PA domain-containing protein [Catelliglobosispora koreensis]